MKGKKDEKKGTMRKETMKRKEQMNRKECWRPYLRKLRNR
jgi:hypothetical protein